MSKKSTVKTPEVPFPVLSHARSYRVVDMVSGKTELQEGIVIRVTQTTKMRLMKWPTPDVDGRTISWRHIDQLYPIHGPEYPSRVEA